MHSYFHVKFTLTQGARTIQHTFTKPIAPKLCVCICSEGDEDREEYNCVLVTFRSKLAPILFEINVLTVHKELHTIPPPLTQEYMYLAP